jgi:hypothetical protein
LYCGKLKADHAAENARRILERDLAKAEEQKLREDTGQLCIIFKHEKTLRESCEIALNTANNRFTAPIVCMIGSTRFRQAWITENARLTKLGYNVLSVGVFSHFESLRADEKLALDRLYKSKIDLCDWVWVLNVGGYVGAGTVDEIKYAEQRRKPIRFLMDVFPLYKEPPDPVCIAQEDLNAANAEYIRLRGVLAEIASVDEKGERLTWQDIEESWKTLIVKARAALGTTDTPQEDKKACEDCGGPLLSRGEIFCRKCDKCYGPRCNSMQQESDDTKHWYNDGEVCALLEGTSDYDL